MFVLIALCTALGTPPLPSWDFTVDGVETQWEANAHLADIALRDGALEARGAGPDPIFFLDELDFAASPRQYLVLRIAADRPGRGEVFFTGTLEGPYQGFSQEKSVPFHVQGEEDFQEIAILPFWQAEGRILRLRLDLYDGALFRIAGLRVAELPPAGAGTSWAFDAEVPDGWHALGPGGRTLWGLLDGVTGVDHGWLAVQVESDGAAPLEVRWAAQAARGFEARHVPLRPGLHWHNVEMQAEPRWEGPLAALGFQLPPGARIRAARLAGAPSGPADFVITYFGVENGANRAGRPISLLAHVENVGGEAGVPGPPVLWVPKGAALKSLPVPIEVPVRPGARTELRLTLLADAAGEYTVRLTLDAETTDATVRVLPEVAAPAADYVPAPRPVETVLDVCAYYFPGWASDAAWAPIRDTAPGRKPVLGYYDEGSPEVVDWQIKWAVENGISCFLVDWYWVAGSQQLTHWFDAYREARYRDQLKTALMWANHNPPMTHSLDDWRAVTQEWIDHYFNLPAYYRIDGMPALFFWSPVNLRDDLGGSEAVAEALALSQAMAREAGHEGIAFVALFDHDTPQQAARLTAEGYHGVTNYHEWGDATHLSGTPNWYRFADVAATAPQAWARRNAQRGALQYYPVADTGWDARPWHGARSQVFEGRTPALWESILRDLKAFALDTGKPFVVLGPINEWGEGSYIEPAAEYDFAMYEAVRRVFAQGEASDWPVNIAPGDVGLGPYAFPPMPHVSEWDFEDGPQGWSAMMGIGGFTAAEGVLRFTTATHDPALHGPAMKLDASKYTALEVTLRGTGDRDTVRDAMQLFWSRGGSMSEAQSVRVPVTHDGEWHTVQLDLGNHPRWRGVITRLRLDPSVRRDVAIEIARIAFVTQGE